MNCVGKQNIWDKRESIIIEETVTWMLAYGKNLAIHSSPCSYLKRSGSLSQSLRMLLF